MLELAMEIGRMNDVEIGATLKALQQEHARRRLNGAVAAERETYGVPEKGADIYRSGRNETLGREELTVENVEDVFSYAPWDERQQASGTVVREALVTAAKAILREVPMCPARTIALNHLQSARMDANRAITWRGRF